ncbi:MAG: nitroreductase family protein [Bacteroidales bacterium]|nr:nitroreductase family protein [Bacteroidales bacterium]
MEYTELIGSRESIRNYDPAKPLSQETLEKILEAGRLAPSAKNLQPWKFLVVSSPEMREKLDLCYRRDWFHDAPHILVVLGNKDEAWVRSYDGYNSVETDLAIAMTHIILAAENEGVGTCWIAAFDPDILRKALYLKSNQVVFGITPLGYPGPGFKKKGVKIRKPLKEIYEFL